MARPRKVDRIDVPAVREALSSGMTRKAVCRLLNIDRKTLWRAMGPGNGVLEHQSGVLEHREPCGAAASHGTNSAPAPEALPCSPRRS